MACDLLLSEFPVTVGRIVSSGAVSTQEAVALEFRKSQDCHVSVAGAWQW